MTNSIQSFINNSYNFYKKIIALGTTDEQTILERQRIKLINFIIVMAILMEFLLMGQAFVSQEWLGASIGLVLIIISFLPLYLNSKNLTSQAVWLFCLYSPISLVVLICLYGKGVSSEYNFFIFTIHLIIFFSRLYERLIFAAYLFVLIAFVNYYTAHFPSPMAREFNIFEQNAIFIASIIFLIIVLKIYTDIVEKNMLDIAQLLHEQKNVNQNLKYKQATIQAQNKELHLRNEELKKFTYIASHDLKTPLRNVTSFLTLIERKIKRGRFDIEEDIQYASRAAKQMYHLIEDILRFSSMKQQLQSFKDVNLNDCVIHVLIRLQDEVQEKNAEVITEMLPNIEANRSQIELLFQNLIENSLKYNVHPKPLIKISSTLSDDFIIIKINDNGIGISMDYQEKVFEMFARLHNNETYEGSGLGLAICKRIASAHNGDIWFSSDGENGTTFFLKLPVIQTNYLSNTIFELEAV